MPVESARVPGIITEKALEKGRNLSEVLSEFNDYVGRSSLIVGHNISFDEKIMGAEFIRKKIFSDFNRI